MIKTRKIRKLFLKQSKLAKLRKYMWEGKSMDTFLLNTTKKEFDVILTFIGF